MKKFATLCAVALASLVLFSACSKSETPEEVAVKFVMELNNENYDAAKALANENGAQMVDLMKSMKDMSSMEGETETEEAVEGTEADAENPEAVENTEAPEAPEAAAPAPKKEEKVMLTEADLEVKKSEVRGDSAFVWVLNKKEAGQGELPLVLVKEGGKWKVDKIDKENK
nr:hypothetical protein [uncultured Porphyromonas sp.]